MWLSRPHRAWSRERQRGQSLEDVIWFVFGFRNGKVAEWRMFGAEHEALEAVGLSEQDAHADS